MTAIDPSLTRLLLGYWQSSPRACDTVEGIQRWWLPGGHNASLSAICLALTWLIDQDAVEVFFAGDLRARYRRHPRASDADLDRVRSKLTPDERLGAT